MRGRRVWAHETTVARLSAPPKNPCRINFNPLHLQKEMSAAEVVFQFGEYTVRQWAAEYRENVANLVRVCLEQYGLQFEPSGADRDAVEVEDCYLREERGEFWVVINRSGKLVGSGGYYEVGALEKAVEIRKMYLLLEARGKKLGRALLEALEKRIAERGYHKIYLETATVLTEACRLYTSAGYKSVCGVETARCDRRMYKMIADTNET